jgi:vacuolar-type H+-ATPase subunit E/Vma4
MDILEKIEQDKVEKVKKIIDESARKNANLLNTLVSGAKEKIAHDLDSFKKEQENVLKQVNREIVLEQSSISNELKNRALVNLKSKLIEYFKNLSGDSLFKTIVELISSSDLSGLSQVGIIVDKKDYTKYLSVLSSESKGSSVVADKLNSAIKGKVKFNLLDTDAKIDVGFLLVTPDYDLSFNFIELIDIKQRDLELLIGRELFESKS